jgi:hypothetical protein
VQILVCGSNDTNIHFPVLVVAQSSEGANARAFSGDGLKHPQQFGLVLQVTFPDFVKEDGPAIDELERPFSFPFGPGKSSSGMPEEF